MAKQKPTCGVEEFEALYAAGLEDRGGSASHVTTPWKHDRRYPGETRRQLKARLEREWQIQEDRENENRRDYSGRVLPVFID